MGAAPGFAMADLLPFGRQRLPVVVQTEASECGLACMAMLASYHGHRTDLGALRLRFPTSRKGATLESLIRIGGALGLECRPLKLDLDAIDALQLPCVLHWDMNHFVVLKSVSARRLVVHDPAVGVRSFTRAEFGKHFTGVAMEVQPTNDFKPAHDTLRITLRGLMGRVSGFKRGLLQILALALVLEFVSIALPFLLQWTVDQALVAADRDLLAVLALGFGLLIVLQAAVSAVRGWVVVSLSTSLNFQWLGNVFSHLVKLPLAFFEKRHVGHILSCFGSINTIQKTLTTGFVQALVDGIMVLGTFGMMLLYAPPLALIAAAAALIYCAIRWGVFRALRSASAEQIIHAARQQTHFLETARGIQSVRLFGRGEQRRIGWLNMLADQFNAELRIQRLHISYETAQMLLFGIERVLVIFLAAHAVLDRQLTVGMLFAFIAYKDQFSTRIAALIDRTSELFMLRLHGERVADIVLTEREQLGAHDADEVDTTAINPSIELRGVWFHYSTTDPAVLRDVNLTVRAGECVAITGPSGCGKTTLVKVMLGLLAPTKGEVLIDGAPIERIGLANYRQLIGTVMQEDRLFSGSVADNICFFDPLPDMARIEACAKLAAIDAEIVEMPMGYNTLTSDQGVGLSGGQVQRILLARALYRQPKILVLDEATSQLDLANEQSVNQAVSEMNLTRLVVAHRPDTIAMADRVITMRAGQVEAAPPASDMRAFGRSARPLDQR